MGCKTSPTAQSRVRSASDGPARRKSLLRAGAAGNTLSTSPSLAWIRRQLGPDEEQVLPAKDVKLQARAVRKSLANAMASGYEAFALEKGQERILWFHGFRLHGFVVLKLRRRECADSVRFVRIEWGSEGLKWSGVEASEGNLQKNSGVLYPFLRSYQPIADPSTALARLDSLILEPLQDTGRQYSLEDFNCCHFSNSIEEVLTPEFARGLWQR